MNISEIAKRAGVSNAAVSRYLNNGYLSEEKRAAIRKVIEETGYRPSAQAQTLRTRKTKTIGVILPQIDSFPLTQVMAGIDSVLEAEGFQILLADCHNDPAREVEYLDLFGNRRVDGVILLGSVFTPAHHEMLQKIGFPVVVAGQQYAGLPCVYHDDYHAFCAITRLVLDKGCRRVGYIGALTQDVAVGSERTRAFRDTVCAAGLADQAEHVAIARFSIDSGREKAQELWERFGPLDALICTTDNMALGAMQFLRSQGVDIPGQVLLTGQGDSTVTEATTPTITTIHYFYRECGADAAALLLEHLADPTAPAKEVKLGYRIIEKGSTQAHT